jgi:hypothetical protein
MMGYKAIQNLKEIKELKNGLSTRAGLWIEILRVTGPVVRSVTHTGMCMHNVWQGIQNILLEFQNNKL